MNRRNQTNKYENKNTVNKCQIMLIVPIVIILLLLILQQNQSFNFVSKENLGTSWNPHIYLKDIRQSTKGSYADIDERKWDPRSLTNDTALETPVFAYFDKGNRFMPLTEVDSLYSNIETDAKNRPFSNINDLSLIREENTSNQYFVDQYDIVSQRGGNA